MTKTYQTYKESGVQWIGQIPEHWENLPLLYALRGSITDGPHETPRLVEDGIPFISIDSLNSSENIDFSVVKKYISEEDYGEYCKKAILEENDILFSKSATIGKTALVPNKKFMVWSPLAIIKPNKSKANYKYMYYVLSNERYLESVCLLASYNTQLNVGMRSLEKSIIPLPPLSEQQAIAEYLDKKTAKIDESIAALEAQKGDLQKYRAAVISEAVTRGLDAAAKMKDSGVEWIGEIPEGWKVSRLKHILTVNGRVGFKGYTTADLVAEGEGAYTIGGKHITNCVLDLSNADYISWSKYYESPEIMVHQGDIVMAQRGTLGKAALIREDIGPATINPSLVLLNQIKLNNLYLLYYLLSNPTQECIKLMNTATAVPMISQNQIENMPIPVPSLFEQQAIAEYLDKKTAKIDESIALIDAQIADLQAYRSTVISEAVTGKVKVS